MPKCILVHNQPAPYRVFLFRTLGKAFEKIGWEFEVFFMARFSSHRPKNWLEGFEVDGFAHRYFESYSIPLRGESYFINPGLVRTLMIERPDIVIVGGPWGSVTGIALSLIKMRPMKKLAWLEANTYTPGVITGPLLHIKRTLLRQFIGFLVPNEEGARFLDLFGVRTSVPTNTLFLPNLVDPTIFKFRRDDLYISKLSAEYQFSQHDRLVIWPARLIPEKGIVEAISELVPGDLCNLKILIVGEGHLEEAIRKTILVRGLQNHIFIKRYVPYLEMPLIYSASAAFILPSITDRNPLSVIEALAIGLPILVSDRVGNWTEALVEGPSGNGWCARYGVLGSFQLAIRKIRDSSMAELAAKGEKSNEIYRAKWAPEVLIGNIVRDIARV
jgi:glycosyltransferase involved in cell wall biosynthesis